MSDDAVIRIRGLVKSFGTKEVLRGVDLDVQGGQILGYVGPNGSGKTTTLKILLGLLPSYEGEVRVAGLDPREQALEVKRCVGYVAENAVLYEALTVAEYLLFVGRLHGLEDDRTRARADLLLASFELTERLDSRLSELSKGMRQKLLLTTALVHDPQILVLDEPLSGLDVNSAMLVKELLRGLAARGRAILFSSHVMDVVERLCDRIVILHKGVVAASGTFEELSSSLRGGSLEGIFADLTREVDATAQAAELLEELDREGAR